MKIGDKVKMINCVEAENHKGEVFIVASESWEVCGTMVAKLEGRRGGFATDCLEVVE